MAFRICRLKNIIKSIHILGTSVAELTRQQAFIESRLLEHQRESTRLDNELDDGKINATVWATKTDILDVLIDEAQNLIDELGSKIKAKEEERAQKEAELNYFSSEEINRVLKNLGLSE